MYTNCYKVILKLIIKNKVGDSPDRHMQNNLSRFVNILHNFATPVSCLCTPPDPPIPRGRGGCRVCHLCK